MVYTAVLYKRYNPALSSTEPTISVSQCTPAASLPITMNAENRMTKAAVIRLTVWLFARLITWNSNVGITLSTSRVVEDG